MNQAVQERERSGWTERLCALSLGRRRACYLIYIVLAIVCCMTGEWASIGSAASAHLPPDADSARGLDIMNAEFAAPVTGKILLDNVSAAQASELADRLSDVSGVWSAEFDEASGYQTGSALLTVAFDGESTSEVRDAVSRLRAALDGYDYAVSVETGGRYFDSERALLVTAIAAAVLIFLTLFLKVPAMSGTSAAVLTFGAAFLLNNGTHFIFGEISALAAWGSALLQFALSVICVTALFRRTLEARTAADARQAVEDAWRRTAPAIVSASLALICAFLGMSLLRLRLGADPGFIFAKSAALTLLTLCVLTPGLLLDFTQPLDFEPDESQTSTAFTEKSRYAVPFLLIAACVAANVGMNYFPRTYGTGVMPDWIPWGTGRAEARIEALFGAENELSILVPAGDVSRESALLEELEAMEEVRTARGLANMEAMDGYALGERLTPRRFAELMNLDADAAEQLYSAYIQEQGRYSQLAAGLDQAALPLGEMLAFTCERAREGYVALDWGRGGTLEALSRRAESATARMSSAHYSRFILSLSDEGAKSYASLYTLRNAVRRYYPEGALMVGETAQNADLSEAFRHDSLLFNALTFAVGALALFAVTGSVAVAAASMLTAQGGVWIAIALLLSLRQDVYFLTDLTLSAAQMGIGLLFALLLAGSWQEYRRNADQYALQDTSRSVTIAGTLVTLAALGAWAASVDPDLSSIGLCMGASTAVSTLLILLVLPQMLLLASKWAREPSAETETPSGAEENSTEVEAVTPQAAPPEVPVMAAVTETENGNDGKEVSADEAN